MTSFLDWLFSDGPTQRMAGGILLTVLCLIVIEPLRLLLRRRNRR